jgi:hypothetical protein
LQSACDTREKGELAGHTVHLLLSKQHNRHACAMMLQCIMAVTTALNLPINIGTVVATKHRQSVVLWPAGQLTDL